MSHPIPLYAVAITQAIAGGELAHLKKLQTEAEAHLKQYGDVATLLSLLKIEIAKLGG